MIKKLLVAMINIQRKKNIFISWLYMHVLIHPKFY